MNLDLFVDDDSASPAEYRKAFQDWLAIELRAGRVQREASASMYEHMWSAFSVWAVGQALRVEDLTPGDLERYLNSRGGHDDLSARYAWRLLRLIGRVLGQYARSTGAPRNDVADQLLARRPDIRFANAAEQDPLPEFLNASDGRRLVTFLSAVRPGRASPGQPWQEVRNRASVALMLGAGLTPGEVRQLMLADVITDGGNSKDTPWKIQITGSSSHARETPVAPWAGQLLRHWLAIRLEQRIPGPFAFPSTKSSGKEWGKVSQYGATKEVLRQAGIDNVDGGSFRLRHTFALRQLKRGTNPNDVARWLGVTDPNVMARYSRVLTAPVELV